MNDQPRSASDRSRRPGLPLIAVVVVVTAVVTAGIVGLLVNIFERKSEARNPFYRVVDLTDETVDPEIWGKNFPLQYDGYKRTVDQVRTRFGGSEAVPRTPSQADPRSIVAQSKLEQDPRLKTMWAGYAFARDFREDRGHAYMLEDQTYTERQIAAKQPGTCLHCHASVYVPYKKLGDGDLIKGFEKMNLMSFAEARKLVTHPVACIDCHAPDTMQLRVTRPGFLEGIRALKEFQGVKNYDVNTMATRQEMRAYVCGQCHVEYYFKGPEKRLVYQQRNFELRNKAMDALVALIGDLKGAMGSGRSDEELTPARDFQRKAQFYLDFVEAENSTGFHAPQEAARILGESIDFARKGQLAVRDLKPK
jgi:nitrite reductase (cytochrome c-552)